MCSMTTKNGLYAVGLRGRFSIIWEDRVLEYLRERGKRDERDGECKSVAYKQVLILT